jgi:Transposase DDE domain
VRLAGPDVGQVPRDVPARAGTDTGIITDEKLTVAAGTENSDAAVAAEFVAAETAAEGARGTGAGHDGDPDQDDAGGQLTWYGDSAYGTGDLRAAIAVAGHQAVIKPWPLLPAVQGGFTADDFIVDTAAGTVTCPAGITRQVTARNAVIFGVACRGCPLRARCTTAKAGRTVHLHEHDSLLRAARADWTAGPELRQDHMAHRPHVERAIAQIATWPGRRLKLRYRGVTRNNAWLSAGPPR